MCFKYFIKKFLQDEGTHKHIPTPALPGSGTVDSNQNPLSQVHLAPTNNIYQ